MGAALDPELLSRAMRSPGRIVLGPTTNTGAFPYGGVSLGFHRRGEAQWRGEYFESKDPASGRVVEAGRRGVEYPEILCQIEGSQWDEDFVQGIFSRASKPTTNSYPLPAESVASGTVIPSVVPVMPPVLIAALDAASPSIYLRRPISLLDLRKSVALSQVEPAGLPIRIIPTPTSDWATNGDYQIGRLEQMVIP